MISCHGRIRLSLVGAILCLIFGAQPLVAQEISNRGREFWVTFLPNFGARSGEEVSALKLYVSCEDAIELIVTYMETGKKRRLLMDIPHSVVELDLNALFGDSCELNDVAATMGKKGISSRSFHIESPMELLLIGADIRVKSADAFLGLPVESLGREYVILSYPSSIEGLAGGSALSMPSQFAVVATEDNTILDIIPAAGLTMNGGIERPFQVWLARGQVFLGQADLDMERDVTGTQVRANRPVAVFGGHKRAGVPISVRSYRDYIVEQLTPVELWKREILMTRQMSNGPEGGAYVRVLGAYPATDVAITQDGMEESYSVGTGEIIEAPVSSGGVSISATQPVMAALYHRSVMQEYPGAAFGDPFMSIAIPSDQFSSEYTFVSIPHPEFMQHYIDLIVPYGETRSLYLDGMSLTGSFSPMPGGRYRSARIPVSPGAHRINSHVAFGLYVYGFGDASSYGYPGGFDFSAKSEVGPIASSSSSTLLLSSSPNPAGGSSARLDIFLQYRENVSITLIDVEGSIVRSIVNNVEMESGAHYFDIDLSGISSGRYFYRAETGRGGISVVPVVVER